MKRKIISCLLIITLGMLFSQNTCLHAEEIDNDRYQLENDVDDGEEKVIHPREDGYWLQYFPLNTALRKNVVISDIITPDSKWENWEGKETETHSMNVESPDNYDDSHNHYQNFLSEVLNFSEGTNAVAIWGDSSAVQNGSKAWGGFFSARSNMREFVDNDVFSKYIPDDVTLKYDKEIYDTQLIGVEVDVLNDGLPGVYPNMSKTGVQIVGFGNPNSMAIEVRSEDTDKDVTQAERRGVFETGIYFKNSIADYGRIIVSDQDYARIGLDFNSTLFSEGAAKIRSEQVGTGILYNDGISGEIYGGKRWSETNDKNEWLTLRAGEGGIRIVSNDNTKELVAIDNYGGIYLNGDIYTNNQLLGTNELPNKWLKIGFSIVSVFVVFVGVLILILLRKIKSLSMEINSIKSNI